MFVCRRLFTNRTLGRQLIRPFWKSKKPAAEPAIKEEEVKDMENLSFLIETVKKQNAIRALPLLPEKSASDSRKLTVCVEMDDVFIFAFYPDELEGYLYQPTM